MADEMNAPCDAPKPVLPAEGGVNPLSYEAPRDRLQREPPTGVFGPGIVAFTGFILSAAVVLFVSGFIFFAVNNDDIERPGNRPASRVAGCIYFFGAAWVAYATYLYWRTKDRKLGRWWTIGCLIGLGAACLLEGVCFVAN